MIAGHETGTPRSRCDLGARKLGKRLEHVRTIEHVAAVHDEVDLVSERGRQSGGVVREEIMTTASPLDSRARRKVEAEVGVREKEDANVRSHPAILRESVFLR